MESTVFRKLFVRLVFFALLGWAVALVRAVRPGGADEWSDGEEDAEAGAAEQEQGEPKPRCSAASSPSSATASRSSSCSSPPRPSTAGAGDLISKALDPARCAALMQTTGEDESICAAVEQEEAFEAAQEEAAAAQPEAAPETAPAEEPLAESDGRRGSSGCGDGRHDCGNRER